MFLRYFLNWPLLEGAGDDGGGGGGSGGTGDGGEGSGGGTIMGSGGNGDNQGSGAAADDQGSGEGADGAGDDGSGDQGAGSGNAWFWSDGQAGQGDRPDWFKGDKYKTVEAQAQATVELEQKLGSAAELIGAPEGGTYEMPEAPEGLKGEFDTKDPLLVGFQKVAGELNLSQSAHDKIVQFMGGVIAEQNEADETALSEALSSLGENVDARVTAVDTYLQAEHGMDGWKALQAAIGNDPAAFRELEKLVGKVAGDAQLSTGEGGGDAGLSKADIEAEEYKRYPDDHKLAGQRIYDHDPAHRKKVDDMWKRAYKGVDRQEVG